MVWIVAAFIILVLCMCGYFAGRKFLSAFVLGIALLLLDTLWLFSLLPARIPSLLFRMWAVYSLIGGFMALRAQKADERGGMAVTMRSGLDDDLVQETEPQS